MWERYKLEHAHIDRYNDPTGWNWYILILFTIDFMTLVFSDLHVGCASRKQLTLYLGISCVYCGRFCKQHCTGSDNFERHGQLCRIWMVARHGFKNKEMNCVPLQPATWGNLWSEENVLRLCNEVSNAFPPNIKVLLGCQASISVFHSDKSNVYIIYIKASSVSSFVVFKKAHMKQYSTEYHSVKTKEIQVLPLTLQFTPIGSMPNNM